MARTVIVPPNRRLYWAVVEDCLVEIHGLTVGFRFVAWDDADAERSHVLDAVKARGYQLARVEQFEVGRAGDMMRCAHVDDGFCAQATTVSHRDAERQATDGSVGIGRSFGDFRVSYAVRGEVQ